LDHAGTTTDQFHRALPFPPEGSTRRGIIRSATPPYPRSKSTAQNRTQNGARAQAVLTSILQTAKQQGKNSFDVVMELLCCREKQKDSRPRTANLENAPRFLERPTASDPCSRNPPCPLWGRSRSRGLRFLNP
jgi:hypothetical protein